MDPQPRRDTGPGKWSDKSHGPTADDKELGGFMSKSLRRAVDLSTIAAAVGLTAMLAWHFSGQFKREKEVQTVQDSLRRFDQMLSMRAAAKDTPMSGRGWPLTMDATWFGNDPPRNVLLTPDRPWIEVAAASEAHLKHPNIRVAADYKTAAFWYNPYQGILRARVPYEISDERAREMYNLINQTTVDSIYGTEMARQPEFDFVGPPVELAGTPIGSESP
jgi:hypothetical protein